MMEREYYSLVEAADIPHGMPDNWPSREKFIKNLIHHAANGRIRFIALTSGRKVRLRTKGDNSSTEPFQIIEHKYCFIDKNFISPFEENCHKLVIGKRSQRRISDNNLPRLHGVCLELPSVLNPSGDPNTYLEFDEPIYLYIDTMFILNSDIQAYLAQKELINNNMTELPPYLNPAHPLHSQELKIAIDAWMAILASNPDKPKGKTRKSLLTNWLKQNSTHKEGSNSFKRIIEMINPDKAGTGKTSED